MSVLTILIAIIVVGFLLWIVESLIPLDPIVKRIFQAVVILVLVIWILQAFGLLGSLGAVRVR